MPPLSFQKAEKHLEEVLVGTEELCSRNHRLSSIHNDSRDLGWVSWQPADTNNMGSPVHLPLQAYKGDVW